MALAFGVITGDVGIGGVTKKQDSVNVQAYLYISPGFEENSNDVGNG